MKKTIYLIDIDGTICEDIKNEDSHLYPIAQTLPHAVETINKMYDEGNVIVFFTARESKDKITTISWLLKHGFKFHDIIMNKPRCIEPDCEYVWIDNKPVKGILYEGKWEDFKN